MSIWYGLHGTVEVRMTPEVDRIVAEFDDLAREITAEPDDHGDGTATVEFSGGVFCSHATVGEIDSKVQELGAYALAPARLAFDYDGERGEVTVGPEGMQPAGRLVVIEVSGGVVQEVYCDDPEARIVLIDWDAEGCTVDEPGIVEVIDDLGRSLPVHAADFPKTPTATMPPETRSAVDLAE
jgi:hypothetical protein